MSGYPDHETYKALYKRFYDGRKPGKLLCLAGDLKGKTVIDLCAGDGRLSLEAVNRGANLIWLFEKEYKMVSYEALHQPQIQTHTINLVTWLENMWYAMLSSSKVDVFDTAFCQQGVNYWLNNATVKHIPVVLKKGGLFIFNTFNKKPPEKPLVKKYELNGKEFVEVSWLIGDTVHHVQIREDMAPHTTSFKWLSPEYLEKILSPYFSITVQNDGSSAIYRCSKK